MNRRRVLPGLLLLALFRPAAAQIPEKFENLKVMPANISRDQLLQAMRSFSSGLGVRCQYCHFERPGPPAPNGLDHIDFKSDQNLQKEKARSMMQMAGVINETLLAKLPERSDPPVRVQCVTCHRGSPVPRTLEMVVADAITKQGIDSAVVQYKRLREETLLLGRYNFGEGTLNELARQLAASGKREEAIRLLQLNLEYFPASPNIKRRLEELGVK